MLRVSVVGQRNERAECIDNGVTQDTQGFKDVRPGLLAARANRNFHFSLICWKHLVMRSFETIWIESIEIIGKQPSQERLGNIVCRDLDSIWIAYDQGGCLSAWSAWALGLLFRHGNDRRLVCV